MGKAFCCCQLEGAPSPASLADPEGVGVRSSDSSTVCCEGAGLDIEIEIEALDLV